MTPTYNRAVARGRDTLRATALLAAGWWTVHQLRYVLAFGADADRVLHREGHAYLAPAGPLVTTLLAVAAAHLVVRAARAPARGSTRSRRLVVLWPACATLLLALYTVQESTEGLLAGGHPGGLSGVFGYGGWTAVPLAILAGLAIAAALRVSEHVEAGGIVRLGELCEALPRPLAAVLLPGPYLAVPAPALARKGAGRAPPARCR